MLESISNFFGGLLLKFIPYLPTSPFDYDDYLDTLDHILGVVNYFVPFYIFAPLLYLWIVTLITAFGVLMLIRYIRSSVT